MKHILFQLLTGFTFGQTVIFRDYIYKIVDYKMITPFTKGIFKVTLKHPIQFTVQLKRNTGGIEVIGHKPFKKDNVMKTVFEAGLTYNEIKNAL